MYYITDGCCCYFMQPSQTLHDKRNDTNTCGSLTFDNVLADTGTQVHKDGLTY